MIVCGAGTGGTITGIARKIKEKCPNAKVSVGLSEIERQFTKDLFCHEFSVFLRSLFTKTGWNPNAVNTHI